MDITYPRCCGIDVHSKFLMACVRISGEKGTATKQTRRFGTMTPDLLELADWLHQQKVTHVAMESTGVFWKPVWNLLESSVTLLLVNARDVKQVPGRKTDVTDSEWLAQLLQYGLLRSSFIPPPPIRELRDLTRHRTILTQQRTAVANRIHKVLEDANIKLGVVASNILGVSGRAMLRAIVAGEDNPTTLANLATHRLRSKIPQLQRALQGRVTTHHRFLLQTLLDHLDFLEAQIAHLSTRIGEVTRPFESQLMRLETIDGVKRRSAEDLLAEVGADMQVFPSAAHQASWAGICPGNHLTGGKRQKGTPAKGNRWLRRVLANAAWAASHTKHTYLSAQYRRLAGRRGKKRAIMAVAHSILVATYHILHDDGVVYHDLGPQHFDRLRPRQLTRYLVKRLEQLGHRVTLEPMPDAA
jgi:transposase